VGANKAVICFSMLFITTKMQQILPLELLEALPVDNRWT
jgi:hypothetical protein